MNYETVPRDLNRSYQPARFHWPRLSGSNFTRAGGNHSPFPDLHTLKKPSPYRVKLNSQSTNFLFQIKLSFKLIRNHLLHYKTAISECQKPGSAVGQKLINRTFWSILWSSSLNFDILLLSLDYGNPCVLLWNSKLWTESPKRNQL